MLTFPLNPNPLASPTGLRIAQTARQAYGQSTAAGPDHGNLACAWAVNRLLKQSIGHEYGVFPDNVVSVREAILRQGGQLIPVDEARPGDLAFAFNESALHGKEGGTAHLGIFVGPKMILANSSSRAQFDGEWSPESFSKLYGYFEVIRPIESLRPFTVWA